MSASNPLEPVSKPAEKLTLNILIATGVYPPEDGGPATYSKLLEDELPKVGEDGKNVSGSSADGIHGSGFKVEVVPFRTVRYLPKVIRHVAYFFILIQRSRVSKSDIIYAQDPVSVGLPALLATAVLNIGKSRSGKNAEKRKKFLLKIVGDYAWEQGVQRNGVRESLDEFAGSLYALPRADANGNGHSHGRRYPALVLFLKNIQKHVAEHADHIIVPSQYLKKIVMKWGVQAGTISVIYNSFDVPSDVLSGTDARAKLGIADKTIISVARLVPWKGLSLLIALLPKIRVEFPGTRLLIAGSGPQEKELKALAAASFVGTFGSSKNPVEFLGQMEHDRLLEYIRAADLLVLNTAYEGLSHLLLETMAIGTPIVTTAVGGNVELIRNGEEGALVQYNDSVELEKAIKRLLGDPLCARGYAERAKIKVEADFGKKRMLSELAALLQTLAAGNMNNSAK